MKILIYGAGKYCDLYLSNRLKSNDTILGIIDRNHEKWGLKKGQYIINSIESIRTVEYDVLIIAAADWKSIIDQLMQDEFNINKVLIYQGEKNKLYSFATIYNRYVENKIYKQNAIKQVKIGLLLESFRYDEYCDFDRIIVVGEENDYLIIKEFFHNIIADKTIISFQKNMQINENDKIILCKGTYKKDLADLHEQLKSERQWIILPFFDVKNTVILREEFE